MDRASLYSNIAKRIDGCTKADVETVLDVFADVVRETLASGNDDMVIVPKLGRFKVKHHNAKSGVSNLTGEAYDKEAWDELKFAASTVTKRL